MVANITAVIRAGDGIHQHISLQDGMVCHQFSFVFSGVGLDRLYYLPYQSPSKPY
jgi:hypothetical protein